MPNPRKTKPTSFTEIITPRNVLIAGIGLLVYGIALYLFGRVVPASLRYYDLLELFFSVVCAAVAVVLAYRKLK